MNSRYVCAGERARSRSIDEFRLKINAIPEGASEFETNWNFGVGDSIIGYVEFCYIGLSEAQLRVAEYCIQMLANRR